MNSGRQKMSGKGTYRADRCVALIAFASIVLLSVTSAQSNGSCENIPTSEQAARKPKLSVTSVSRNFGWEKSTKPVKIVGPLYFVGTKGLGVFLFATSEGHILMNTGMPSSGPMIVASICKLGFKPEDIKIMINGHAHIDHAGALSCFKANFKPQLAVMSKEITAMKQGGADDFSLKDDAVYPPVVADRVLEHGNTVRLGDVELTAYHTPGHTPGATTWVTKITDRGETYLVVFPDGAGFNPGYRLVKNSSYPGISDDFRRTHHLLEMLKPDIWLTPHNEYYDFAGKRKRALTEGVSAWIDREGYRRFIAKKSVRLKTKSTLK